MMKEHLGDVVNSTGALKTLRRELPEAKITVSVGEWAAGVLANSPDYDALIIRPKARDFGSKWRFRWQLLGGRFQAAIILDEARSQARNAMLSFIPVRYGIAANEKASYLTQSVPFDWKTHESFDQYDRLLRMLGIENPDPRLYLYPSEEDRKLASELASSVGGPLVLIHPGAGEPTRRWLPERFAQVARTLSEGGVGVAITGSPSELSQCEEVARLAGVNIPVWAGKTSPLQFAALAALAKAVIVGDTGPMHLAAAMGTKVIAIYGPAEPVRTGPWGEGHAILQAGCACTRRWWENCTMECMRNLSAEQVIDAARERISK